ncbi:MAG TPA: DUF5666 domain-containing protein [Anaerolinea sp.]|nr:DUF5666 domain-containing protein [Anaerolinea sp.]
METTDNLLEQYVQRLESGEPLERVLSSLPADQSDLAPLLRVAAQTMTAQHPQMNPLKAQSQRRRVVSASNPSKKNRLGWLLVPAGLGSLAVFAFLVVLVGVLAFGAPAGASAATLRDVQGVVEVSSQANPGVWNVAVDGQQVRQGALIRTRLDSGATLVFFEGSRAAIGPDASLVLQQVSGGWDRSLKVLINQTAGETDHQVVKLRGPQSFYEVLTPAGKAQVHGTAFQVDVNPQDGVRFAVDHGVVAVSQGDAAVTLTAGQATLVQPDGSPDDPSFEFMAQGEITSIVGDVWTVSGLVIQVPADVANGFVVGDHVVVRGRILPDGTYVADRVSYANNEKIKMHFTGVVEQMGADAWVISGKTVKVDGQTEIDEGLKVGDPVSVSFVVLEDGSWLAREIEALEQEEDDKPTATPTATVEGTLTDTPEPSETPEGSETPTPSVTPTETATPETSVTPTPTLSGERAGCERTDWKHPEGLRLAQRWGVSYEEIMGWFCQGYGFGEIDLAYELAQQSGKPVTEVFAMRASGMGWGNIKKALEPQSTQGPKVKPTKEPKPTKAPNPHKKP